MEEEIFLESKDPLKNIVYNEAVEDTNTESKNNNNNPVENKSPNSNGKFKGLVYKDNIDPEITFDNRISGIKLEDYTSYLGSNIFIPDEGGIDTLNKSRALNQSAWSQAGNMLGQAVVGEIIGGTIEGLGYILDVGSALDYMTGNETEWGNFLTDVGKSTREFSQESMPIYTQNPGKFDPSDSGWWFSNGVSVASSLSMLVPSMAATKALGFLGKTASRTAGKFSRILDVAENMGKKATWMTEGISQAVVSRHIENAMEASGTFESAKEDYLTKIDPKTNLPFTEEEATRLASEAAASNYNKGWAMLLQDIPQYLALGKIFNPHTGRMENALSRASKAGKEIKLKPWQQKVGAGLGTFLSEGFEESYQYYIAEQSKALSDLNAGLINREKYDEIMNEAIGSDEMMTSAFFGGLGGNLFQFAGKGLNELQKGSERRALEKNYETTYRSTLNDRAKSFMAAQQKLADADNNNNLEAREMILDDMMLSMTIDSLHRGKFDQHIEALEGIANMTKEEANALKEQGGGDFNLELAKKNIPEIIRKSEEMRNDYLKFSNKYEANIAAKMAENNYRTKRFADNSKKMDNEINSIISSIPDSNKISPTKMDVINAEVEIAALTAMNNAFKNQLESKKVSDLRKPFIEKLISENDKRIERKNKVYEADKLDDPRDEEAKRLDAMYSAGFTREVIDELVHANMVKERNSAEILLNQLENDAISTEKYRNGLKKEVLHEKVKAKVESKEQAQEIKKEIEEATFLTKDEKAAELAAVEDNEAELANEAYVAQKYKEDKAREEARLTEIAEEAKDTRTITNANKAKIEDNIEDEFGDEQPDVFRREKEKEKSQEISTNGKSSSNIKVPLFEGLNGPGWKKWVFNGKDKTGAKDGKPVLLDFVIGDPGGANAELGKQAIAIYNKSKRNSSVKLTEKEKDILFNYLPIKIQLSEDIWSYIPAFSKGNQFYMTNEFPKRKTIIREMFRGNTKTQVSYQFGGNLHVQKTEDNTIPQNSIMEFDFIKGNIGKVDLMVSNEYGTLVRASDKSDHPDFEGMQISVLQTLDKKKSTIPYKGGVFLNVPKANGLPFPLKLNLRKPTIQEASFVADVMIAVITKKLKSESLLSDNPELFKRFKEDHPAEFAVLGKDAKTSDVTKLFVHMTDETAGKETHLHYTGSWIHYGLGGEQGFKGIVTPENIEHNRDALVGFIHQEKRRQLNLKQWNEPGVGAKYRDMMLNGVLTTDAYVGSEGTLFNEEKTLGRDNGLPPFKFDIAFKVPESNSVSEEKKEVVKKEPTVSNKEIDSREKASEAAGTFHERENARFVGVYFDKINRNRIPVYGKSEAIVKKLIKEKYDAERLALPAQKAAIVIEEVKQEAPKQEAPKQEVKKEEVVEKDNLPKGVSAMKKSLEKSLSEREYSRRDMPDSTIFLNEDGSYKESGSYYEGKYTKASGQHEVNLKNDLLKFAQDKFNKDKQLETLFNSPLIDKISEIIGNIGPKEFESMVKTYPFEERGLFSEDISVWLSSNLDKIESIEAMMDKELNKDLDSIEENTILDETLEEIKDVPDLEDYSFENTKLENVTIDGISRPGYLIKINGQPKVKFFTTQYNLVDGKLSKSKHWTVFDVTTGKRFPIIGNFGGTSYFKKEVLGDIHDSVELYSKSKNDRKVLEEEVGFQSTKIEETIARNKMAERELKANKTVEVESIEEAKDAENIDKNKEAKEIDPNIIRTEEQGDWDCIL